MHCAFIKYKYCFQCFNSKTPQKTSILSLSIDRTVISRLAIHYTVSLSLYMSYLLKEDV